MMKLSIMHEFLENGSTVLVNFLEKWGVEEKSVEFLRASSNFVYSFEKNHKKYILRITPEGDKSKLLNELNFLSFLNEKNVSVNIPIRSENGNIVETITSSLGVFYAVVFNFIEGQLFEIEDINEEHFYLWGNALGELHYHSNQYIKNTNLQEKYTLQELLEQTDEYLPANEVYARRELAVIKNWMENLDITTKRYGLIHFDFELDNLIWSEKNVGIIDFESSVEGWFVADIAFALRDLFSNEVDLLDSSFQLFLNGYRNNVEITDPEIEQIPLFLRFHNLVTFAKLIKVTDVESNSNNPNWVEELIFKLKSKIEDYRISFKNNIAVDNDRTMHMTNPMISEKEFTK